MMDEIRRISGLDDQSILGFLDIKKGYSVIDIGGGDGFFGKKFMQFTDDVTVLDFNDRYFENLKNSGIKTIKEDICHYNKGKYDLVFMSNVYHDLVYECREDVLKNIQKIAKRYIAVLDFKPEETPFGPPLKIRLGKSQVIEDMGSIGFKQSKELELKYHYLLLFEK
ncbi:methyltransferase domain-containing protein [Candidatus Parvarchaeota archaeon]|nr:methyltransferase domain-containing protein [Candidatus Parvarchaeota archaeon]